ncbi:MAG: FkbM family methyltransferase [Desulfomonilaceae bacterium]
MKKHNLANDLVTRIWGLRKWRRLSSVVLRRLRISHLFTIRTSGIKLRFYPAVWNMHLWENPDKFKEDINLLYMYLRPGNTIVDLGANVGLITLVAAKIIGSRGVVYSFEPHPKTYTFLAGNIEHNRAPNVKTYNVALGDHDGEVEFSDGLPDDGNHVLFDEAGIKVPVNRLDTLLPELTTVHLLKIDVEGFEKFVFDGAHRILAKTRCIYFESSSNLFARYGYTCADVFSQLKGKGFSVYRLVDPDSLQGIGDDYISQEIENLIAVKDLGQFLSLTGLRIT